MSNTQKIKTKHSVQYDNWGYFFIAPFFIVYIIFSLIPLLSTFWSSLFEHYRIGLQEIGPNFKGLENFKKVFQSDILRYLWNTVIMWIFGFIPQIIVSLMLSVWFTNSELRLKCQQFFKTVIYMPNLIMASAFSMLFFALFSDIGPINSMLQNIGAIDEAYKFLSHTSSARWLVAFMNFLMWFGNTTILLLAGMLGIDTSLYEAAEVDGATSTQIFFRITLPILRPILIYVMITSLIGGLQMFDVPQILTNGEGSPVRTTMTLIMYLNKHLYSKNYGMGGALSVMLFIITGILSIIVFKFNQQSEK